MDVTAATFKIQIDLSNSQFPEKSPNQEKQ